MGDGVTDDTTAFQNWITSVTASGTKSGWFWFEPGTYLIGGALQDTGARNAQILLPNVSTSNPQITLRFSGPARPPLSVHGPIPTPNGYAILKSTLTGASGTAAVVSGGNGPRNATWNNIEVIVENLICLAPSDPTFTWWNLSVCQGGGMSGVYICTTTDWVGTRVQPTHSNSYGYRLPQWADSNYTYVSGVAVGGFYTGFQQGELAICFDVGGAFCINACELPPSGHSSVIAYLGQTGCTYGINVTGVHYCDVWLYDAEHVQTTPAWAVTVFDLNDPSNYMIGHIRWMNVAAAIGPDHIFNINGGANVHSEEMGALPAGAPSGSAGGDLSSTYPNPTVAKLQGRALAATAPGDGQAIVWDATGSTWKPGTVASSGTGSDHEHVDDVLFSGDGSTVAFELPAAPFDAYSVQAFVAGTLTEVTLSGAMLTTATFGSAPGAGTNNVRFDITAALV